MNALKDICGIEVKDRSEIKVNPVAVNHFTWLTKAQYKNMDLFPVYAEFAKKYAETGYEQVDVNWMNAAFVCSEKVKLDLFNRYGYIAAAGDRHLAEFCPGKWYLKDRETAESWGFGLTTVAWRKHNMQERLDKSKKLRDKEIPVELQGTGEEGVQQIRALLGLRELVTNVNIPNRGQIPNLPIGAVVETNAVFRDDSVTPGVDIRDSVAILFTNALYAVGDRAKFIHNMCLLQNSFNTAYFPKLIISDCMCDCKNFSNIKL